MKRRRSKDGGRPSKKSKAVVDKILELIADGNYYITAVKACGISYSTFTRWMKEDKEFRKSVKRAEAEGEAACIKKIKIAGEKNWTAVAWRLERRWPDRWGKRDSHAVEHSLDKNYPVVTALPPGYTIDVPDAPTERGDNET